MSGDPIKRTWYLIRDRHRILEVRAYDYDEACRLAVEASDMTLAPCCEPPDPYCSECQKQADDDGIDRRIDIARGA